MDEARIESLGIRPFLEELTAIDNIAQPGDQPAAFQFSYGTDLDRALTALWRGVVGETAPPAAGRKP